MAADKGKTLGWNMSSLLANTPSHNSRTERRDDDKHRTYDECKIRNSPGKKTVHAHVSAPTNIAVIKYWGKKDAGLNTPINSSASLTLDQRHLRAITSAAASPDYESDRLWLNGVEEDVSNNKRFQTVLAAVRRLAQDKRDAYSGVLVRKADWPLYKVHVVSKNTFPTAAGLASSAAGYAALTKALAELFAAEEEFPGQLTAIARQGSGSASRSLYGGLVEWTAGEMEDGSDSIAKQIADEATDQPAAG